MRRLAAIMFTDLVGYSALSQTNEALAIELLEEHRRLLRPIFTQFDGHEIETAGDAFFVEFNSAVEAVNCAIEIQDALHQRNLKSDAGRKIVLRIGLHIGDVVYMDQHVHGDGVNIAARLEPLAQPGGICVSEDVARQVRNKIKYEVVHAGTEKLKNIGMPMDVYCIALPWLRAGLSKGKSSKGGRKNAVALVSAAIIVGLLAAFLFFTTRNGAKASSTVKHRLAVLPLKNISSNTKDDYFADGLTEELISSIGRIGGLSVIARTSIMKYKETTKDIGQIGEELMVGTVLEGSVRRLNNKARITVQLVDVDKQENLWSQDYDRELSDIFSIQSEIASSIAKELKLRLVEADVNRVNHAATQNMEAFQEYLAGRHFVNQRTSESIKTGIEHLENAVKLDPAFILPYPVIAYAYSLIGAAGYGGADRTIADNKAKEAVKKALSLDSALAEAHAASAYVKFRIDWDWDGAEAGFRKAIELKPGYATAHEWYALYLAVRGRLDEALREIRLAHDLDPLSPSVNTGIARIYHFRNEPDKSLEQIRKTLKLDPSYAEAHFTAGMTYSKLRDYSSAERELIKAVELSGRRPVMVALMGSNYVKMGRRDEALKLLKELQQPPMNNDKLYAIATIQIALGGFDENFWIMEKLVKEKYGIMIYMKVQREYFEYARNPRFEKLIKEIGL
jgi:adenylate cyclase